MREAEGWRDVGHVRSTSSAEVRRVLRSLNATHAIKGSKGTAMRIRRLVLMPLLIGFVTSLLAVHQTASHGDKSHSWGYEGTYGPAHWGDLEPDYSACKVGRRQSPIDIRGAKLSSLPAIQFDYKASPLKIINNGHTIQINYAPGSFISFGGDRYELRQFHFHHPSEERVAGKRYDMVIHMVHADGAGHLAVVAVLLRAGNASPEIQELWDNMPKTEGKEYSPPGLEINATSLLPASLGYYTFQGSLTTPPCSEGVTWYVLKTPIEASREEIAAFSRIYRDNSRPIQPTNGRLIEESR
jgi:carbonic anhydrase